MLISVGDVELFVEIVGTKLAREGGDVREKPTIVLLHGGPAWDHLTLLPGFAPLATDAQLVFYDHRGLGRSDGADRRSWTLKQWAADLRVLIDRLGIDRPIILGQSFGGIVAQQFAIDYPGSYSGLILSATAARFDLAAVVAHFHQLGGERLAAMARAFFTASNPDERDRFLVEGLPFYTVRRETIGASSSFKADVLDHFFSADGEAHRFDFRERLAAVTVPTLVIGGEDDPVMLPAAVRELGAAFAEGIATTVLFDQCGHGPTRDRPEAALALMRDFLALVPPGGAAS